MKYLKYLQTTNDFESFKNSENYILPNVSYVVETKGVSYDPYIPPPPPLPLPIEVGDVAYWDGSSVKTVSLEGYDSSMGTAVGVVVIPENFLPDGRARMIALDQSTESKNWANGSTDVSDLINYNRLPITNNVDSTATRSDSIGYLPSDIFTGSQSFVDPLAKYQESYSLIPSPYLSDGTLNPEYCKDIEGYKNALSDFDGKGSTDILVGLGSGYAAANHAKDYTVNGVSGIDWYLPACGELGVMTVRLGKINEVIESLGGVAVPKYTNLWSSNEYKSSYAYTINTSYGYVNTSLKYSNPGHVRSFAMID